MDRSISLALNVRADASTVFQAVSSTAGQRAFWTADCEVGADRARFGFAAAPVDLQVAVNAEPGKQVRTHVTSGFPVLGGLDLGMGDRPPGPCRHRHRGALPTSRIRRRVRRDRIRLHGAHLSDDPGPADSA